MTRRSTSSTSHSSSAAIETRCWASTSSGFCGIDRLLDLAFAHAPGDDRALEQVAAVLGEDPALARPRRARARRGRSAAGRGSPTSATRPGSPGRRRPCRSRARARRSRRGREAAPDLSSSSTRVRSSWESEPWWARAISTRARCGLVEPPRCCSSSPPECPACSVAGSSCSPSPLASSFRRLARRSAGAAVVDEDDRRGVFLDQLQELRVDRRPDRADVGAGLDFLGGDAVLARVGGRPGSAMSSTGTTISRSSFFGSPASTISHSRFGPTRNCAIRSSGRWVRRARSAGPRGLAGALDEWSSRSSVSARCEPRFDWATAWISSTITASVGRGSRGRPRRASGRATPAW